jgi:hypothetical protein
VDTDRAVPWRVFLGIAGFIAVIGAIYWFVSYEDAGTTLLALASGLALFFGGWLFLQDRKGRDGGAGPARREPDPGPRGSGGVPREHYLPESSVWPFGLGVGVFLAFNGLILGLAWTVPGAVLVATSVGGLVLQSRQRS